MTNTFAEASSTKKKTVI